MAQGDGAGFTAEEKAAMKERAKEAKAEKAGRTRADGEKDVLAKIAEMAPGEKAIAQRIHALVAQVAPELVPRTWYGMPAYAQEGRNGKVVCFFQPGEKFKSRYSTLGFNDAAALDDGQMWATTFAVLAISDDVESQIVSLLARATGR
jgi:uncharacterized protein YdhG (YjbR/CyaY superfamily)